MYSLAQVAIEQTPQPPPPRKGSAQIRSPTEKVSLLPRPVSPLISNNHYERIPARKTDKPVSTAKSGTYDRLSDDPSSALAKSGKYDSLSPAHDPALTKSGKYDSLSPPPETSGAVENPYILSSQHESPQDLVMAASDRGDMYVMLPPMSAFASLKEEINSEKKRKNESEMDLPKHGTLETTENPYSTT